MKSWQLVFLGIAINGFNARAEQAFLGPIPVQYSSPGAELVLDMHRFFQPAAGTKLQCSAPSDVEATFDSGAMQLHVRSKTKGIFDIDLSVAAGKERLRSILTVVSTAGPALHHFSLKPASPATKVYLAGSFNGWSHDKNPMKGPDADGTYSTDVALEPGRYAYKFLVDEKWVLDPASSETEDNGLGEKNCVLIIEADPKNAPPVLFADHLKGDLLVLRHVAGSSAITRVSAIFEQPNGSIPVAAKIAGDSIELALPPKRAGFIRVIAANSENIPSNVVRCPVGSDKSFRWQDAVLYYAFTDRFADGDRGNDHPVEDPHVAPPANFHGGDLVGIRQTIEEGYFDQIHASTIWVAPLNRNPAGAYQESPEPHRWYTGYHGYWPISSTEIDPHIGTDRDLRALVETAHAHGMKVIADLVLHHVHTEHPWWKQHRDWFGSLDLPDGRKNLRLWDEQQFTTWFEPYLPSFDFTKPAPVQALIDNSIWWANTYKLDGFRLDAVKHILPSFWWKFRAALREKVDRQRSTPLFLVGETFKDRAGIMSFVGPNMLDGQFDFPLYDQIKETFGRNLGEMKTLDDGLASSEKIYGKETLMSPLVGNHDKGRFMAYADGELPATNGAKEEEVGWKNPPAVRDPANYKKLELAQAFLMSIDGVPMIYYGDEIGMTGAGDPDNRRDMRFGDQLSPDEQRVLENFKRLGAIRQAHPALRYGSRRKVMVDHDLYAFVRAHLDDRVAVVFNRSTNEAKINIDVAPELKDGDYVEALSGKSVSVKDGKLDFVLPAQTAAFITASK